jgi:hypothetical protein
MTVRALLMLFAALVFAAMGSATVTRFNGHPPPRKQTADYQTLSLLEREQLLAKLERDRSQSLWRSLSRQGYELYGFYHMSVLHPHWKEVLAEQLRLLDGQRVFPSVNNTRWNSSRYSLYEYVRESTGTGTSPARRRQYASLLSMSAGLFLNVVGFDSANAKRDLQQVRDFVTQLNLRYGDKIVFHYNDSLGRDVFENSSKQQQRVFEETDGLSCGEYPTMMALHGFCRNYVHANDQLISARQRQGGEFRGESRGKVGVNGERISATPPPLNVGPHALPLDTFPFRRVSTSPQKALVYYLHLKGSCCPTVAGDLTPSPAAAWRQYMNAFNIEFPSICMRAVGRLRYATCGVEYQEEHYSGNFWWSDCEHWSQLPPLKERFNWIEPEYIPVRVADYSPFMTAFARHCSYSAFSSGGLNLYNTEIARESYLSRLWESVVTSSSSNTQLPKRMQQDQNEFQEYPGMLSSVSQSTYLFVLSIGLSVCPIVC